MPVQLSSDDLQRIRPAKVRALVGGEWVDCDVPERRKRWSVVAQTVSTLRAEQVQLLGPEGQILRAMQEPDDEPVTVSAQPADPLTVLLRAQELALAAQARYSDRHLATVEKLADSFGKMLGATAQMLQSLAEVGKAQGEQIGRLTEMVAELTAETVDARLDAAEAEGQGKSDRQEKLVVLAEKALEVFGPAVAEKLTE